MLTYTFSCLLAFLKKIGKISEKQLNAIYLALGLCILVVIITKWLEQNDKKFLKQAS
jgi:hypothetical protein